MKSLRASYAAALQDREDAETQEALYVKRLDAEMRNSDTMKKEVRAMQSSRDELNRTLNQLEADTQKESCTVPEHAQLQDELQELTTKHLQLEKQHIQQSITLAEFQKESDSLEGRLSNIGIEKPQSVTESGMLMSHVALMERRATLSTTEGLPAVEQESGDLDGDTETAGTDDSGDQCMPGSTEIHPGGIKMKSKSLAHL